MVADRRLRRAAERVLLRHHRRRRLEDDRRRQDRRPGHRRLLRRHDRRDRRRREESRRRLGRRRRDADSRQRLVRRRRVEDDRRRQDLDVHGSQGDAADLARQHRPAQLRRRLRRRARPRLGAERRARRLQDDRRRQDLEEDPLPQRFDRRDRARDGSDAIPDVLYAALWQAGRKPWLLDQRRQRRRHLQDDRRRRALDGDHAQSGAADGLDRQRRHDALAGEAEPHLGADRERAERRRLSLRRRRRDVDAAQPEPRSPPARVVLLARLRRSEGHEHRLRPQRRHVRVARRRQDLRRDARGAAAATITTCGSRRTIRSASRSRTTRARSSRPTAARRCVASTRRPDSSITCIC